jgi:hypothetical protein
MKTRQGFVSNSSSSSFVIIIAKPAFDTLYAGLDDVQRDMVAYVSENCTPATFGNGEVVALTFMEGNYSTFENYTPGDGGVYKQPTVKDADGKDVLLDDCEVEEWYETFDKVKKQIKKLSKNSVLEFMVDC